MDELKVTLTYPTLSVLLDGLQTSKSAVDCVTFGRADEIIEAVKAAKESAFNGSKDTAELSIEPELFISCASVLAAKVDEMEANEQTGTELYKGLLDATKGFFKVLGVDYEETKKEVEQAKSTVSGSLSFGTTRAEHEWLITNLEGLISRTERDIVGRLTRGKEFLVKAKETLGKLKEQDSVNIPDMTLLYALTTSRADRDATAKSLRDKIRKALIAGGVDVERLDKSYAEIEKLSPDECMKTLLK